MSIFREYCCYVRYNGLHEKTFARWYRRSFDLCEFNKLLIAQELPKDHDLIGVVDANFWTCVVDGYVLLMAMCC